MIDDRRCAQLTKEQLLAVLPLLIKHLTSDNYVAYTYAAITIYRIMFIKKGTQLLYVITSTSFHAYIHDPHWFTQADVHDFAADLLNAVLTKMEGAGTPEKVAENDHLMKCMFAHSLYCVAHDDTWTRRDARDRHGTSDVDARLSKVLQRLVAILGTISKNPSNPNFDQYLFESTPVLMRCVRGRCANNDTDTRGQVRLHGTPATLSTFEQVLFGPFTVVLQQDIDRKCTLPFVRVPHTMTHPRVHSIYVSNTCSNAVTAHHRRPLLPFLLTLAS